MKANYGSKKSGPLFPKATQTTVPNKNIKQQNMKMQVNNKKNQRMISKRGRT